MANPQKENGFTPIANELLEAFYRCKMVEYERVLVLCIWRKTYGWNKSSDWIANSQLSLETGIPKPHITRTLTALKGKQIVTSSGNKSVQVNKDYSLWKVDWRVTSPGNKVTSPGNKKLPHQVPTKEKKDNIQKKLGGRGVDKSKSTTLLGGTVKDMATFNPLGAEVIKALESVDPKNKSYYNNNTQRSACDFLIEHYGLQTVVERIALVAKTNGLLYFPTITTPVQLRDKWVQHEKQLQRHYQEKKQNNKVAF